MPADNAILYLQSLFFFTVFKKSFSSVVPPRSRYEVSGEEMDITSKNRKAF